MTGQQKRALDFITGFLASVGHSPSYEEIVAGLALRSRSNASRLVHALVAQGRVTIRPGCNRSIELVDTDLATIPTSRLWAELERRRAF